MGRANRNYVGEFKSSFFSCEKDMESIIRKLFVESKPYSDYLKRLLLINTSDCLDDMTNPVYLDKIKNTSIKDMKDNGFIKFEPKIKLQENEEVKNYIIVSYDNFFPNSNDPYYRDCIVMIDILCHTDYWDLGNYRIRPLKIAGYIDGILNNSKLSGIGKLEFAGCSELILNETISGYCLVYNAIHGVDDLGEIDIVK